jgi:hypothetical protein
MFHKQHKTPHQRRQGIPAANSGPECYTAPFVASAETDSMQQLDGLRNNIQRCFLGNQQVLETVPSPV